MNHLKVSVVNGKFSIDGIVPATRGTHKSTRVVRYFVGDEMFECLEAANARATELGLDWFSVRRREITDA